MILSDAPVVLEWENDPDNWLISDGEGPYVIEDIIDLVNNIEDVQSSCQTRYIIFEKASNRPIGTIDLFDMDFTAGSAGVGILIADKEDRGKGYGKDSILLVEKVAEKFGLTKLIATIHADNLSSLALFRSCDYVFYKDQIEVKTNESGNIHKVIFEKCLGK